MTDFFHMNKRTIKTGRTKAYAGYISRIGKHEKRGDLVELNQANFPEESRSPLEYFEALDRFERANGGATEYVVALPRELTPAQQRELAKELATGLAGPSPVLWAVHCPDAALEGGKQPHLHALTCHRLPDGISRPLGQQFKRHDAKHPERGGWKKNSGGDTLGAVKARLKCAREFTSEVLNAHLEQSGSDSRVDHRSYRDRGIDRPATKHLGAERVRLLLVDRDAP